MKAAAIASIVILCSNTRSSSSLKQQQLGFDAIKDTDDIEKAAEWIRRHPQVAKKMTGAGLLACFDEDIKKY